jgi:hypothetical protein
MGRRLAFVPVLCAVLLAGCGHAREGAGLSTSEARAKLPLMVLPHRAFAASGTGFEMDRESGRVDNRTAARGSIESRDTARTVARSGRVDGYRLTFADPHGLRLRSQAELYCLGTEVELFRDDATASRISAGSARISSALKDGRGSA